MGGERLLVDPNRHSLFLPPQDQVALAVIVVWVTRSRSAAFLCHIADTKEAIAMKRDSGGPRTRGGGHSREFRRSVRALEKNLNRMTDAEFINWDESLLACPKPGSF